MYDKNNKNSILSLFNDISSDYDKMNNIMTFGMQKKIKIEAIRKISINSPNIIVDLCTGTGDMAVLLAEKYPNSKIYAVDFSANMLKIAKDKTKKYKNIEFLESDIMNLPFEDNSIDLLFISFGLRNLPDITESLCFFHRKLKQNGLLSILDLGKITPVLKTIFEIYFFRIVPLIGQLVHKNKKPYEYLVNSMPEYPSPTAILTEMNNCGFKHLKNHNYLFGALAQQTGVK